MAASIDIEVREAVDWTMDPHPIVQDQNGNVVDVTGWLFVMKVRAGSTLAATVLLTLIGGSGILNGGATGEVTPYANAAQLAAIANGVYPFDLLGTDLTGRTYCILAGNFIVDFTVSQ